MVNINFNATSYSIPYKYTIQIGLGGKKLCKLHKLYKLYLSFKGYVQWVFHPQRNMVMQNILYDYATIAWQTEKFWSSSQI